MTTFDELFSRIIRNDHLPEDGWFMATSTATEAGTITKTQFLRAVWDLKHWPRCVLYMEDDEVVECVSCGEVRP